MKTGKQASIEIIGDQHSVDFERKTGKWIENKERLEKLIKTIEKKLKTAYKKRIAIELTSKQLNYARALARELKKQASPERLFFREIKELKGEKLGRIASEALAINETPIKLLAERVYTARLVDFLDKAGIKIIPIDSKELFNKTIEIAKKHGWLDRKTRDLAFKRDRFFAKTLLRLYRNNRMPSIIIVGIGHALNLSEIMSKHFKVKLTLIEKKSKRMDRIELWKDLIMARERFYQKRAEKIKHGIKRKRGL